MHLVVAIGRSLETVPLGLRVRHGALRVGFIQDLLHRVGAARPDSKFLVVTHADSAVCDRVPAFERGREEVERAALMRSTARRTVRLRSIRSRGRPVGRNACGVVGQRVQYDETNLRIKCAVRRIVTCAPEQQVRSISPVARSFLSCIAAEARVYRNR